MQIIPAVDIKNGKCVRLTQGLPKSAIVYEDNPLKAALRWQNEGAQYLHLVDIDGALCGKPVNFKIIKDILQKIKIPAEVGGGIRNLAVIKEYANAGADRIVLGTKPVSHFDFLKKTLNLYRDKIAVAIDTKEGNIVIEGWTQKTGIKALDLAKKMLDIGVKTIIYTDTITDGTLKGPNFKGISEFAKGIGANPAPRDVTSGGFTGGGVNLIISGGISSIEDLKKLKKIKGIKGVIIGKALYTGKINLKEALSC